jgi:acyl-CoA synthetase (NDP forming)
LLSYSSLKEFERINDFFIEIRGRQSKPLLIVLPPGSSEPERLDLERRLSKASIAVFPTMERAAKAIVAINSWSGFKGGAESSRQPLQ